MQTRTDVLTEIGDLIREVLEEPDLDVPITRETTFQQDLAFESIDLVVLGTRVTERYGPAVDLPGFLAEMTIHEIIALRVGDLVDHVVASCS